MSNRKSLPTTTGDAKYSVTKRHAKNPPASGTELKRLVSDKFLKRGSVKGFHALLGVQLPSIAQSIKLNVPADNILGNLVSDTVEPIERFTIKNLTEGRKKLTKRSKEEVQFLMKSF